VNALLEIWPIEEALDSALPFIFFLRELHVVRILAGAGAQCRLDDSSKIKTGEGHSLFESFGSRRFNVLLDFLLVHILDARKVESSLFLAEGGLSFRVVTLSLETSCSLGWSYFWLLISGRFIIGGWKSSSRIFEKLLVGLSRLEIFVPRVWACLLEALVFLVNNGQYRMA
jgi:hypothetical protein